MPVVDVQQGGQCLTGACGEGSAVQGCGEDEGGHDCSDHGRGQAAKPAQPECLQPETAVPVPGTHEVRGDEVSGQREEDPHPQQSTGEARDAEVIEDHHRDRECAQPVQPRDIRGPLVHRLRHAEPPYLSASAVTGRLLPCSAAPGHVQYLRLPRLHIIFPRPKIAPWEEVSTVNPRICSCFPPEAPAGHPRDTPCISARACLRDCPRTGAVTLPGGRRPSAFSAIRGRAASLPSRESQGGRPPSPPPSPRPDPPLPSPPP